MSDLISRRDAIKTSLEFFVEFLGGAFHENAQKELMARFQRLPSADRRRWIPVSEALPEKNKEVLISLEWGVDIGWYDEDGWESEWISHYDDDDILAWQPLPKPYREDGEA